jgi:CcmD family protein
LSVLEAIHPDDRARRARARRVGCTGIRAGTTAAQPAQDEFVPIDQLPPDEKLPAARLLIAAYAVAWVLVAGYLFSIWQRLGRVEQEIADATRRIGQQSKGPRPAQRDTGGRG